MVTYGSSEKCTSCQKTVYLTEKIVVEDKEEKKTFHKVCLKCSHCKVTLSLGNYASMNGIFYCKPHFKQLFATKGNYDEGFGKEKHTTNWSAQSAGAAPSSFVPVEKSAVEKNQTTANPDVAKKFTVGSSEKCTSCEKTVYATEKVVLEETDSRKIFHKACLKCSECKINLTLGTISQVGGSLFCKVHGKAQNQSQPNDSKPSVVSTGPASFVPVEKTSIEKNQTTSNPDVAKKFTVGSSEKCTSCEKTVYATEKVVLEESDSRKIFHKTCLRCSECKVILTLGTVTQSDGQLYCKTHAKLPTKRNDNPFPYLEKKEAYVPSVEKVEQEQAAAQESEMERYKRLTEMKYVEDVQPKRPTYQEQQEKVEQEQAQVEEEKKEEENKEEQEEEEKEEEKKEEEQVAVQEEEKKEEEEEEKKEEVAVEEEENKQDDE
ncbi:LIM-type zinc finger-containing protein [Cavenderia fasciculata]|uniref:LIM-type zinc finger-containing protein n=1 Tax=Cavenderia fasciculata TaxID=261658 RepID=F4PRF4_CACFS|nr:LIM-type zinc finger-containing protein [Cavenderia fasciculata]EGG20506.1 LIM-type zinc finger-containing protein [Cavenderia fasciculata]|eukprot:XP_004358356.1 LIM-type zinc finger-containing protein [Cavenderia fasciculata]